MKDIQGFPDSNIDPRLKDAEWCKKYAKAIWHHWGGLRTGCLHGGMSIEGDMNYDVIAKHMEGRQDPAEYRSIMGLDADARETPMNVDWAILQVMPKMLRIVNGLLSKMQYECGFIPRDSTAVDRKNTWFAQMRAKIEMRDMIMQELGPKQGAQAVKQLGLDRSSEEPGDVEELEMQALYTWKDVVATDWTKDVHTILSANKIDVLRAYNRMSLFYYGVAGYKDWIDSGGNLRIRSVDVRNLIVSYCKNKDFSDSLYWGEVISMTMADFAEANQHISVPDLLKMAQSVSAPRAHDISTWDKAKGLVISVLDVQWPSVDEDNYETGTTTRTGATYLVRRPYNKSGDNYVRHRRKMMYRCKWVIGTDHAWDAGLCTDQKRAKNQRTEVVSDFSLFAPVMTDMRISSIGASVIPIIRQIQVGWLRYQKTVGEYRSRGISINLAGLSKNNYGKGGKVLTPSETLDLFLQGNIHLFFAEERYDGKASLVKPIDIVEGTGMEDILAWVNVIQTQIQLLKDSIGLNEYTDASTPDARTLGATLNAAVVATNNSLNDIVMADEILLGMLSESIVVRLQDMIDLGLTDRLALAIGDSSVALLKENPRLAPKDWGIEVRRIANEEEKAQLLQQMSQLMGADMLEAQDVVMIKSCTNLRDAEHILGYRMKKRKEEKQRQSQQLQLQNGQIQTESAIAIEKERQETLRIEGDIKKYVADKQAWATVESAKISAGVSMTNKTMEIESKQMEMAEPAGS
jgi:hypothetical protein